LRNRHAEWFTVAVLSNQQRGVGYDISPSEARGALRRAGAKVLPTVAHRLASEMESVTPDKKAGHWQTVVGPVFDGLWPFDHELQTAASTSKLVQLLLTTGAAFPAAEKRLPSRPLCGVQQSPLALRFRCQSSFDLDGAIDFGAEVTNGALDL
jgi:hypothetical protein